MSSSDWIEFWDTKHSIYVNARHEAAHFRRIAEDIRALCAGRRGVMLDYGCGEALSADRVAEPCRAADPVRAGAERARHARRALCRQRQDRRAQARGHRDDAGGLDRRHRHAFGSAIPERRGNSTRWSRLFRRLLKPGGLLVVGDVIPRKLSALADARTLLRFGWQEGFYLGGAAGPVPHLFLRLPAASQIARADALRCRRNHGQARSRGLLGGTRPLQTSATITSE